jgi:uncharacterized protein YjdB
MSIPLRGLSIQIPSSLYAGQVITAIARPIPANATTSSISWESSDPTIATVSESGVVTVNSTIGPSSFILTVTDGNYSGSVEITILPTIDSVVFGLSNKTTSIGTILSTATSFVWNDGLQYSTSITYVSSNPSVATVDSSGVIQAIANGTNAIITGYASTLTIQYASTILNIEPRLNTADEPLIDGYIYVNSISVGKFTNAYLVIEPQNVIVTETVWSSSDTTVAYIDPSTGQILGLSNGTCIISAVVTNAFNSITISSPIIQCITPISSIVLTPPSILGLQLQDQYTSTLSGVLSFFPTSASFPRPTWTSLNPEIAMVDADYEANTLTITGLSNGTTQISVVSQDSNRISTMMNVSVENGLTTVTTNTIPESLIVGATFQVTLTGVGSNSLDAYYSVVEWSSANLNVCTISKQGLITATGPGSSLVSVKVSGQSGTVTETFTIVVQRGVTSIIVTPAYLNLPIGSTRTLAATVYPSNAYNKVLQWTSSTPAIATVNASGLVTAIKSGTTTITAASTDGSNISSAITLNVGGPLTAATITMPSTTLYIGSPMQASVSINPTTSISDFTYWNPSTEPIDTYQINTIHQVTDKGVVIPGGLGSSTFRVSLGNQYGNTVSTVSQVITILSPVKALELNRSMTMTVGESSVVAINIIPSDASVQTLSWRSSLSSVARINASSGLVQAVSPGTAYIKATTTDGTNISATIVIIVVA